MQIRADEVRPESLLSCSLRYFPIKGTLTVANIKEDANVPLQPNFKKTLMHTYLHMGENNYRVYKYLNTLDIMEVVLEMRKWKGLPRPSFCLSS